MYVRIAKQFDLKCLLQVESECNWNSM